MKTLIVSSLFALFSLAAFAETSASSYLPECKDKEGTVIPDTVDQLKTVMNSKEDRPQIIVTGVVSSILPEDHDGLPHQKYVLAVTSQIKILVVSNLDFNRIPLQVGKTISVCGEFKKVGQGMVHWTHFDPHGGHPDGFTIVDGQLYGNTEVPGFN